MAFVAGEGDGSRRERSVDDPQETIGPMCFDVTEVTVAAYRECVGAGACSPPAEGGFCNGSRVDRSDHPINCVDWCQAAAYCSHAARRLPTSSEWLWAARGPRGRTYPWGDRRPDDGTPCWKRYDFDRREGSGTCAASGSPSDVTPEGLSGLGGNVREWTASQWRPETEGWWKGVRGGSWDTDPRYGSVRPDVNLRANAAWRVPDIGFRCALDVTAAAAGTRGP